MTRRNGDVAANPVRHVGRDVAPRLESIDGLFEALRAAGIRHAHWKSNHRLARMRSGLDDIDLLVDPSERASVETILSSRGFLPGERLASREHPAVSHHFGVDAVAGRVVHVHLYSDIVTGGVLTKDYVLPLRDAILARPHFEDEIPVPSPSAGLVCALVRLGLKRSTWLGRRLVRRERHEAARELSWLRSLGASREESLALARDALGSAAAVAVSRGWDETELDGLADVDVPMARSIRRALEPFRCRGIVDSSWLSARRLLRAGIGRLVPRVRRRSFPGGGLVVAVVGPKATGKSTIIAGLRKRFGAEFRCRELHVGKPRPTLRTLIPWMTLPLARRFRPSERTSSYEARDDVPDGAREGASYSWIFLVRRACLAFERRRAVGRAHIAAGRGCLVLCDRYPTRTPRRPDSPRFSRADIQRESSRFKRYLMTLERDLYAKIPDPDRVIRLHASPDVAARRDASRDKPGGPDEAAVRRRHALGAPEFPGVEVIDVTTECDLDRALAEAALAVFYGRAGRHSTRREEIVNEETVSDGVRHGR